MTSRARLVLVALVAGAMTHFVLSVTMPAAPRAAGTALSQGKPIERELHQGETHVYEVAVPAGRIVNGVVDQRGVDVVVRVLDPSGAVIATIDSPNGPAGPEPWSLDGKAPGTWRIEVSAFPAAAPGRYEARIDEIITADERDERLAHARYRSPRLFRLWRERRADGAAALERLVKEMEGHAPLVEPVEGDPRGDVLVTFLRHGPGERRYVGIASGPAAVHGEVALLRFEDTDLRYVTVRIPADARFTYTFRVGEQPPPGATFKQMMALAPSVEPDAWNPHHSVTSSLVELPGAPAQPWLQRDPAVPAGHVVERTLRSDVLHEDRKIGVYLPAAFKPGGGPYPYVVVFDGDAYGHSPEPLIPTPIILDNLIAQGKVPPMLAVLVDSGARGREHDLAMAPPFGAFLAGELAPWVRREYRGAEDPARVTLAGSSLGGLAAVYYAFHHADVFGNALSQSGSFWYTPGAMDVESPYQLETGAMMREVLAAPPQPVRFWMEVGTFEGGGGLAGSSMVAQNRHLRDLLLAKGYRVAYHEFNGGHDYACWRGSLADGLMALAGAGGK
jgi:enterochelin esterase family protein